MSFTLFGGLIVSLTGARLDFFEPVDGFKKKPEADEPGR